MAILDGFKDFFSGLGRGIGIFVCERHNFVSMASNPGAVMRSVR